MSKTVRVPQLVRAGLESGLLTERQAQRYLANYRHFREQRPVIKALHPGQWVAAVNGRVYAAATEAALRRRIAKERDWRRAYIRFIERH